MPTDRIEYSNHENARQEHRGYVLERDPKTMLISIFRDDHCLTSMGTYTTFQLARNAVDHFLEGQEAFYYSIPRRKQNNEPSGT